MTLSPGPHGQAALMLYESLALLLIEQGIVRKQLVVEAIKGVIEVKQEIAGTSEPVVVSVASILLIQNILQSINAAADLSEPGKLCS